jgi:hypothetical protein
MQVVLYSMDTQQLDRCVCTTSAQQTSSRRVSCWILPFTPTTTKPVVVFQLFRTFQFSFILSDNKTCHQRAAGRRNSMQLQCDHAAQARKRKCNTMQARSHAADRDGNLIVSPCFATRENHNSCMQSCYSDVHARFRCQVTFGYSEMLWYDHAVHLRSSETSRQILRNDQVILESMD